MLSLLSQPNDLNSINSNSCSQSSKSRLLIWHSLASSSCIWSNCSFSSSCLPYCLIKVHCSETVTSVEGGKGGLVSWGRSEVKEVRKVVASSAILKVRD